MKKSLLITGVLLSTLLLTGCGGQENAEITSGDAIGMANPASVFCVEQGGNSELRTDGSGNQYGVCLFADGTEIEERELYRSAQTQTGTENQVETGTTETVFPSTQTTSDKSIGTSSNKPTQTSTGISKTQPSNGNLGAVQIANPASEYCVKQGGKSEIRKDKDGGEYGVCIFENGREIEEWALYRASDYIGLSVEAAQAKAEQNNTLFRIVEEDGNPMAVTADLRPGRINAVVNKGIVTSVNIEG